MIRAETEGKAEQEGVEETPYNKSPFKIILALFLVFLLLALFIPVYKIRVDPEPDFDKIPSHELLLAELALININASNGGGDKNIPLSSMDKILSIESMPVIRQAAVKISAVSCKDQGVCYVKALYYFTRDKIKYVNDPAKQYIQHPTETLVTGGGDCEDKNLLLAYMLKAIAVPSRICLTSEHAFIEVWLPEARAGYKTKDDWVTLDATSQLDFGKISYQHANARCDIYI